MAFVYRAARHELKLSTGEQVGPGSYIEANLEDDEPNISLIGGVRNNRPFNSTTVRDIQSVRRANEQVPGPGHYNIQPNPMEKVVISSPDEDIKVIEIPKPSSFFRDVQPRFAATAEDKNPKPGPGSYCIENPKNYWKSSGISTATAHRLDKPKNLIEELMQINKYSSIPSIPSKQHQLGYNENENNVLELNQPGISLVNSEARRGPGLYEVRPVLQPRNRGVSWSIQNNQEGKSMTQEKYDKSFVGPGSYEISFAATAMAPLCKMKQSAAFASKQERDSRRGVKSNSFIASRGGSRQSTVSTAVPQDGNQEEDDDDSEFEYIQDATPGPGYYNTDTSISSSIRPVWRAEKFQNFGSRQERFQANRAERSTSLTVGPGHYNPVDPKLEQKSMGKGTSMVPFGSRNTRFEQKIFEETKPSPGQYEPRNSLEDRLIYRISRGYRGNFGSTERRFQLGAADQERPGPGAYLEPISEKELEDLKMTSVFASKTKRNMTLPKKKTMDPAPGSYNIDAFDIHKKLVEDEEDDPDLVVKKPGFLSGEPRFKNKSKSGKRSEEEESMYAHHQHTKQISDLYKKKPKQDLPFGGKAKRFASQKPNTQAAPGSYFNPQQHNWNKKTYNILFAEV